MFEYLKEVLYLIGGEQRSKLPGLILLFLGLSILDLAGIGLIGPYVSLVIDSSALDGTLGEVVQAIGLPREKEPVLIFLGWSLIGIFLVKSVAAIWINRTIILFGQKQQARLRSVLMGAYQSLPYTEYLRRNSAEYIYSIETLVGRVQAITLLFLRILSDSIIALVLISMLAFQNGLALVLLVGLLGSVVIIYDRLFRHKMRKYGQKSNLAATTMVQGIHEGIEGLKEIRILGRERYFHQLIYNATKKLAYFQTQEQVIQTTPRFLMELLMIIFIVTLVVGTLLLGQNIEILIPTLAMFGIAALRLLPIANMLSGSFARVRFERDAVSRLYGELSKFEQTTFNDSKPVSILTQNPFYNLILDKVSFRYPDATQDALKEITLEIRTGESIGLIGASGSGKTTLVDLLLGLIEPYKGEITYNGKQMSELLNEWRSHVAYLPQQVFLVDSTLRQNVALGCDKGEIDDLKVQESLRRARLLDLVNQLPKGIHTTLGERGVRLSGGQRQRVALARAFYHERSVLVMDESTSALDKETENEIVAEIQQFKGEKTMIVIAHRLSTVESCDRIYRFDQGRIVEQGSPEEIFNRKIV